MLFCKLFWQKCSSGGCKSLKYPVQEGMVIGYLTWVKKHLVTHFPKNLILAWVYFFNFYLMPLLSFWHFSCCHFYLLKLNQQVLKNETKFETHSKGRWHDSPASLYEVIANQMIDVHSEGGKSRNNSNNNATMICQWLLSYPWLLSDPSPIIGYACHSLTHSLTDWLTDCRLVNLIDVTLACEDAYSKLVEVVTVADVDSEDHVGNSLLQIWELTFGPKANFCSDFDSKFEKS